MNITLDTNLILRTLLNDDPRQSAAASQALKSATLVAVTLPTLCEVAWVMKSRYRLPRSVIADYLRLVITTEKVAVDSAAVEAGLATLEAGGDFADGVIAHEGRRLGGEVFATFDRAAAARLKRGGFATKVLA